METLKKAPLSQRSRSLSSSSYLSTESVILAPDRLSRPKKQRQSTQKTLYVNSPPQHQQQTADNDSAQNSAQKELDSLRQMLIERNNLIERQKLDNELQQQQLFYLNENKISELQSNQNLLTQLESQQALIISMKKKLNEKENQLRQALDNDETPRGGEHLR